MEGELKNFEKQIYNCMKASGMLFPNSDEDVKSFEKNFPSISDIVPDSLTPDKLFEAMRRSENAPLVNRAAFKAKTKHEEGDNKL